MAQQVKVIVVDDLSGGPADETLSFTIEGTSYEIDLSKENADKFRDAVAPYIGAARRVGRGGRGNGSRGGRRSSSSERRGRAADIRAWARTKGIKVNERGRIPADIVEQYESAH